ncbi:MAG TPA: phenylacetate--CoA ligase [Panacibacter sp.]|nr:phenylacetate--CoA ligase [Panacibacter sp.]HNP45909.1 phenylacetate--CoA ligase [Panacibacter sp.]
MYFNERIETMPVNALRKIQSEKLVQQLQYMYRNQPFYKKLWDEKNININKIKSIHDIQLLPLTTKDDLRNNYPFGLFAAPHEDIIRIHCSSGSTGKPTVVGYTKNDLDIFSETVARSLCCAGAKPGMKLHNAYGYGLFTGGLGLHYGAELLGMSVIPVSGGMTERQIMLLQDFGAEIISCTPSYALVLADKIRNEDPRLKKINLKYAVLGAEPWTEAIRKEVEQKLGVIATNIYGLSEICGPGISQEDFEEKNGSHIWEDHFYPEVIDTETKQPLAEGRDGILVFTTLTKTGMPLMRYMTNDICCLFYDKASKRTHVKMSGIKGRHDDMLIIRGVNLFHTQVEALLEHHPEFSNNYQLIVERENNLDKVTVAIELSEYIYREIGNSIETLGESNLYLDKLKHGLHERIKSNIGLSMDIQLRDLSSIPKSEGGKLKRIVDLRK